MRDKHGFTRAARGANEQEMVSVPLRAHMFLHCTHGPRAVQKRVRRYRVKQVQRNRKALALFAPPITVGVRITALYSSHTRRAAFT